MKIKELIKELKAYDQNAEVYLAHDSEMNDVRTILEVCNYQDGHFDAKDNWIEDGVYITIVPTDTVVCS